MLQLQEPNYVLPQILSKPLTIKQTAQAFIHSQGLSRSQDKPHRTQRIQNMNSAPKKGFQNLQLLQSD